MFSRDLKVTLEELKSHEQYLNRFRSNATNYKIDGSCQHFNLSTDHIRGGGGTATDERGTIECRDEGGGLLHHMRRKYEAYPPTTLICTCEASCVCYIEGPCQTNICSKCQSPHNVITVYTYLGKNWLDLTKDEHWVYKKNADKEIKKECSRCGVVFINKGSNNDNV